MTIFLAIQQSGYPESRGCITQVFAFSDEERANKKTDELETSWHDSSNIEVELDIEQTNL